MSRRLVLIATLAATACASVATAVAGASAVSPRALPLDNGVEALSADAVVAAAAAAGESARSAHIHGGGTSGGQRLSLNMRVGMNRGAGRISANGLTFEVIRVGTSAYFKGDSKFWLKAGGPKFAPFAQLFAGKWMKSSATKGALAPLAGLTNVGSLVRQILGRHGTLVNDGPTTFAGHAVVAIRDTTEGGTLYVATTGRPYPLGIQKAGSSGGTIYLDHWNAALSISSPAHSIDVSSFQTK
jgi:hypothetical protein